jgi:hypothetical protein
VVLPDMLVMKNRAGIAECRLGVRVIIRQILYDAEHSPCERQYYANNQQENNRNFHGVTLQKT